MLLLNHLLMIHNSVCVVEPYSGIVEVIFTKHRNKLFAVVFQILVCPSEALLVFYSEKILLIVVYKFL